MSTIYTYHAECPALAEAPAATDVLLVYDTSAGRTKTITADYLAGAVSAPVVTTATSLTITAAAHANRTVRIDSAAPVAITLPQATGTGNKYRFVVGVAATGTASTIKVANATDVMRGYAFAVTTTSDNAEGFKTSATSDTISMNGTTLGGVVGDIYEIEDLLTGVFSVKCFTAPTGTEATPFSATVS
ncbi:hypothetical protein GA0061099_10217 [Bradyrhizobium yuanmingense]|uniref:Uncharacterized protein n=1 Tax=Bradyrhizobium yuanmingense TaxID=108015 RepID=A0A1C3XHC8_9BRAD|nr:hypothetical protein [Bradyrhizobium yuanmingense]TWI18984.1 hypothetical protein IQ15_07010 [Bradyrhizobium yuanmingense]SCB51670.1 hypothetical protein GA0061099_10217 [Bradyrhizobium yuanmingense]